MNQEQYLFESGGLRRADLWWLGSNHHETMNAELKGGRAVKVQACPFHHFMLPGAVGRETGVLDSLEGGFGERMFEQVITEASELIGW